MRQCDMKGHEITTPMCQAQMHRSLRCNEKLNITNLQRHKPAKAAFDSTEPIKAEVLIQQAENEFFASEVRGNRLVIEAKR